MKMSLSLYYFLMFFMLLISGLLRCEYEAQLEDETINFSSRVKRDGGKIRFYGRHKADRFIKLAKADGYFDNIVAAYSPDFGCKVMDGRVSKMYAIPGGSFISPVMCSICFNTVDDCSCFQPPPPRIEEAHHD